MKTIKIMILQIALFATFFKVHGTNLTSLIIGLGLFIIILSLIEDFKKERL
jgi:hypothetical protein